MQAYDITTMEGLQGAAREILGSLPERTIGAAVLALSGDLGAGKTTFVQTLGALLRVADVVTSPTFTIMKRYATGHPVWHTLVHIDAYRIESIDEIEVLGFEGLLRENGTIICIEWPERIAERIPQDAVPLTLSVAPDKTRSLVVSH